MSQRQLPVFILILIHFLLVIKCTATAAAGINRFENFAKEYSSDEEASVQGDDFNGSFAGVKFDKRSTEDSRTAAHRNNQRTGSDSVRPLMCLDGSGNEVDWWVVYKEPNGRRYLYYSSRTVEEEGFLPLNRDYLIDDPDTSPVLQTIYHTDREAGASEVWFGWNDQPHDGKDAFENSVNGVKHAHSKGFYAQNAAIDPKIPSQATIGSYAILTSLPKFPMTESIQPTNFGAAAKNRLPGDQRKIFGSNLDDNGQHFVCLSFPRQKVTLEKKESVYEAPIVSSAAHVNFLTKYLRTIHPAVIGTNFRDQGKNFYIWRRYFSMLKLPYPSAQFYQDSMNFSEKLMAYSRTALPSLSSSHIPSNSENIFPLTASPFYLEKNGLVHNYNSSHTTWRWESQYSDQNGCYNGAQDSACLGSFSFTTTSLQSPLKLQLFAKHGRVLMDLFDDWAALQLTQSQEWMDNHYTYTGQVVDRYGLVVQSWIDSKTILPRRPDKKIYNQSTGEVIAKVHIDNVSDFKMPRGGGNTLRVETSHKDHSKWAIGFALDSFNNDESGGLVKRKYAFKPVVFFADLNRATTQIQLKDKPQGRGGGILAIGSANLWRAMMALNPRSYKSRAVNKNKRVARALQTRLSGHTRASLSPTSLPLIPLRPSLFKTFRLSKTEAKAPVKAVRFVPFLNELSKFLKEAEFKSERVAMFAFQRLFHLVSRGQVEGSAQSAWNSTQTQVNLFESQSENLDPLPLFMKLPQLNFYRQSGSNQRLVRSSDSDGFVEMSVLDSLKMKMARVPRSVSVQTEEVKTGLNGFEADMFNALEELSEEEYDDEEGEEESERRRYSSSDSDSDSSDSDSDSNASGSDFNDSDSNDSDSSGYYDSDGDYHRRRRRSSDDWQTEYYDIMMRNSEDEYEEDYF